jgi:hypothetical protein
MELIGITNLPADIQVAVRTLTVGGFVLEKAARNPTFALIYAYRYDEFGGKQQYCFAIFDSPPTENEIVSAEIAAKHNEYELVIISPVAIKEKASIEWSHFLNLFGGPVFSYSPLDAEFADHILELSINRLPVGLEGKPDDLFELYTHRALEFIFGCRVNRYGQERRFETCPDGAILKDKVFTALYDTKAYFNGYEVDSNSIRQFGSYVTDFQQRYGSIFDLNAFIVISGTFSSSANSLENRSRQFLSEARVPLVFLTAKTIVEMINLLSEFPSARRAINWRKIFVHPVVTLGLLQQEIETITKDKIVLKQER